MDGLWAFPTCKLVSKMASIRLLLAVFNIELSVKTLQALFPLVHRW